MKLHHSAYKISVGYSSLLQNFCEMFDAKLVWEGNDQGREIAMKFHNGFLIQFSEVLENPIISRNKKETHIAFSSINPKMDLINLKKWFKERGIKVKTGKWSNNELWMDCPDVFINFVIEIIKE